VIQYPESINWEDKFNRWVQLKAEYGAAGLEEKVAEIMSLLRTKTEELIALPEDQALAEVEPNDLETIQALRPQGNRRIWSNIPMEVYKNRLEGALIGRFTGCTLGSPVELFSIEKMSNWAKYLGDPFPPQDYWSQVERPHDLKYKVSPRGTFTPSLMDGVPTDDDIIYTQLGLLILEDYGPNFSIEDVGEAWLKYLPYAHTAEEVALRNLHNGVPAKQAGSIDNPYVQYIGADIRSDPWGYAAPGWPEKAAELAYKDAYLSHRRNGIYGAMYFSAVIAAAFTVEDPVEALHIGLEEIPASCLLAQEIRWALAEAKNVHNYLDANQAVQARYAGMHKVHTINNACLTIWGLTIGGRDFTKIIGETVAMGFDNDCTAATAGSIAGAVLGKAGIPEHWYKNFNNKIISYLNGQIQFAFDDFVNRFASQAEKVFTQ